MQPDRRDLDNAIQHVEWATEILGGTLGFFGEDQSTSRHNHRSRSGEPKWRAATLRTVIVEALHRSEGSWPQGAVPWPLEHAPLIGASRPTVALCRRMSASVGSNSRGRTGTTSMRRAWALASGNCCDASRNLLLSATPLYQQPLSRVR